MHKHMLRRIAALITAMLMAVLLLATVACAIDISDFDPNPGAAHVVTSLESDFAPQDMAPFTISVGDVLHYTATTRLSNDTVKSIGLTLAAPFELESLELRYLADTGEILGWTVCDRTDKKEINIKPDDLDQAPDRIDVEYTVRAVSTLLAGRNGMKNRLLVTYENVGDVIVESEPVYTNVIQLKIVDTALPKMDPPKSSNGTAYAVVDTYPGQHLTGARYILYKDENCETPIFGMPSFRRYDVCPEEEYGATAIIEATGGPIDIVGLPTGTYWLKSIMPPDGAYGAPSAAIPVMCGLKGANSETPGMPEFTTVKYESTGTKLALDYKTMRTTNRRQILIVSAVGALAGAAAVVWYLTHKKSNDQPTNERKV